MMDMSRLESILSGHGLHTISLGAPRLNRPEPVTGNENYLGDFIITNTQHYERNDSDEPNNLPHQTNGSSSSEPDHSPVQPSQCNQISYLTIRTVKQKQKPKKQKKKQKKEKMPNVTPIPQPQTANQQMTAIYMNRLQEEISSGKKKTK
jgi:hypothetical protein